MASAATDEVARNAILFDALDVLEDGIAVYDADRRLIHANAALREQFEKVSDILVPGSRWEDVLQAARHRGVYSEPTVPDAEWMANLGASGGEPVEVTHEDGRVFSVVYEAMEKGGFVMTRRDVTNTVDGQAANAERLSLLEHLTDNCPTSLLIARAETSEIVYCTPSYRELHGDLTHATQHYVDPAERQRFVERVRKQGRVDGYRARVIERTGDIREMAIAGRLTEFQDEPMIVSTATDLNQHLEHANMLRQVLEAFPAPVLMTEAKSGKILFKSAAIDSLFGVNANTRAFYVNPEDRQDFLTELHKKGIVTEYRARMRNAGGAPFWCAVSARLIEYEGREVIVSYSRDMTEELETQDELSTQRERVHQNEKMTAMGSLLAGVAHELNNPLSVVVGHALMLRDSSENTEIAHQTAKISEAAERCARIVKTFLSLARQKPVEIRNADLNSIVATALDVARFADGAGEVELVTELDPTLPEFALDADQMTQVLINLVLNAEGSIVDSGRGSAVRVKTEAASKGLRISVEDDGPGVPVAIRSRIFEPFFSTKDVGEGTGVGLSFCHRVVSAHGGEIRLDTRHRPGARFVIDLPFATAESPSTVSMKTRGAALKARILVIDDEPDVADLNAEMLKRSGYEVTVAHSGDAGLAQLETSGFDALITDLNMPGTDGRGIFDAVNRIAPHLVNRIGFITGDTMGRSSQDFLKEARRPFLEKPVSPNELRDFVAGLLAKENVK